MHFAYEILDVFLVTVCYITQSDAMRISGSLHIKRVLLHNLKLKKTIPIIIIIFESLN